MKNTLPLISISMLIMALTCTCKKEETPNSLPPNTEIGANTFIFRVNGGEIINSQVGYIPAKPRLYIFYNHKDPVYGDYIFSITGGKELLGINKFVTIHIQYMPKCGIYKLFEYAPAGKGDYALYDDLNPVELYYNTDANNTGELNITKLDTTNHIISGTFLFKAKRWCLSGGCNEVVTVDGQFDVKYKPNIGVNYY